MAELSSLTRDEAAERAALITVDRYDIEVDMTGLEEGEDLRSVSSVTFSCKQPGASTFVDCVAEVLSATINAVPVPQEAIADDRITLDDLAADNTLVVEAVQGSTRHGAGVKRTVDPSDKEVYIWTSFEPDDARMVWACFDQPDLKARFAFTVTAPERWTVLSNSGDPVIEAVGDAKRWTFPDTPPLSTYVPVVNAGPFYELRREIGGYDLGLFSRKSLSAYLDRDADELFSVTASGLAFFGEQFAQPFPQGKYDQVFVPDMGGAMENWGCVTWLDAFLYRSAPTPAERESRALVLLHEMAHMWFGDLVTMKWWEDLWLNEAFAEWACHWAAVEATEFTEAWSSFLAGWKLGGYSADMAPTTHPIRQPVRDVAEAAANFDGITYPKGASVLKQLVVYVGETAFVSALQDYFAQHAWGNTELRDLMAAIEQASGKDLAAWTEGWLDTAGTDRLVLHRAENGDLTLRATAPGGGPARPHRLGVGVYDRDGEGLVRRELVDVETTGELTRVGGVAAADLLLVNDDDLTFASTRPDSSSRDRLLDSALRLPTSVSRAVAVTTAWDMLMTSDATAGEFVTCVTGVLRRESADSVVEPFLRLAVTAAERWSSDDVRAELLSSVANMSLALAENPDRRRVGLRALARCAVTPRQLERLREGIEGDIDLRWRVLMRVAELGEFDQAEVDALDREDPDPEAWVRALAVQAARPDPEAKQVIWDAVVEKRDIPMGSLGEVSTAFWRPGQDEVLAPYAERYRQAIPSMHAEGMLAAMAISNAMFPRFGVDSSFADSLVDAAQAPGVSPLVSKNVVEAVDLLRRMLVARGQAG